MNLAPLNKYIEMCEYYVKYVNESKDDHAMFKFLCAAGESELAYKVYASLFSGADAYGFKDDAAIYTFIARQMRGTLVHTLHNAVASEVQREHLNIATVLKLIADLLCEVEIERVQSMLIEMSVLLIQIL